MKKTVAIALLTMIAMLIAVPVFASDVAAAEVGSAVGPMAAIGAGIAIGFAALGTGIGMGTGLSKACEGVARNPGAFGKIMTIMIVGLALIESLCIYALLIALGMLINQSIFF